MGYGIKDISGERFGKLVAVERIGKTKQGASVWKCQCDCGNEHAVSIGNWKKLTFSCGCLRSKLKSKECKALAQTNVIHGYSRRGHKTPEYVIYCAAKQRCTNPNVRNYKDYGGRGIQFNFNSFLEFLRTVGFRPNATLTLERINNDGNYEQGNIKWATRDEQLKNRRPREQWAS